MLSLSGPSVTEISSRNVWQGGESSMTLPLSATHANLIHIVFSSVPLDVAGKSIVSVVVIWLTSPYQECQGIRHGPRSTLSSYVTGVEVRAQISQMNEVYSSHLN